MYHMKKLYEYFGYHNRTSILETNIVWHCSCVCNFSG